MLDKMIVLIGMPGCGKTTIGRILAQELDVPFVDTDNLIREADIRITDWTPTIRMLSK